MNFFLGFPGSPEPPDVFEHDFPKPGSAGHRYDSPMACRECGMTQGTFCAAVATRTALREIRELRRRVSRLQEIVERERME